MIRIKAPDRHDVKSRCKRSNITKKAEMKPLPHSYEVALSGGPTGYATLSTDGVPIMSSAPPKDFDGPGDAWSPEHLLLASVLACFMFTFRAVARGIEIRVRVSGSVRQRNRRSEGRRDALYRDRAQAAAQAA